MSSIKAINSTYKELSPKISKTATRIANGLSKFKGADALLPVLLIESSVTGGRTIQAYKRGGVTEARERFVEQGVSAVVWLFGVKVLNAIIDKIGGKFLNKDYIKADVAKDSLRNPFKNIVKDNQTKLAAFKFGKLAVSVTLATAFIGFILPKMIKKMTNKHLAEDKNQQQSNTQEAQTKTQKQEQDKNTQQTNTVISNTQSAKNEESKNKMSIDNFIKNTKNEEKSGMSFKGGEQIVNRLLDITNKLENDTKYRLMSTDVGIITGRTLNARNKYEAREFLFRDTASVYFYLFCADHVLRVLSKASGNVNIHPQAALATADMLIKNPDMLKELAENMRETPANVDGLFKSKNGEIIFADFEKIFGSQSSIMEKAKEMAKSQINSDGKMFLNEQQVQSVLLDELFKDAKDDVISFKDFGKIFGAQETVMEKAKKMTELQPIFDNERFLSRQQAQDVLSGKLTSNPEFLFNAFNRVTKGKFAEPDKYVSKKELEKVRASIDTFVEKMIKSAKDKEITPELINGYLKRNLALNSAFTLAGIVLSGAALAVFIPKIQCLMTKKATGSSEFPGVTNYDKK